MIKTTKFPFQSLMAGIILIGLSLSLFPASATIFFEDGANRTVTDVYNLMNTTKPEDNIRAVVFYYDPECSACTPAHEYLKTYIVDHLGTNVEMINLSDRQVAKDRLNNTYIVYHRE